MTSEVESRMVSRRRILPLLGLAAAAGLALRSTAAEAQTTGMADGVKSGAESASIRRYERRGGTPAAKQPAQGQPAQAQPPAQKQ